VIALTRRARRRRALETPFPDAWRELLGADLVHWSLLDDDERARMEDLIRVFVVDKKWEATNGFELTDEVRVLISAMACFLILGLDYSLYDGVSWIEVQPTTRVSSAPRLVGVSSAPGVPGVVSDAPVGLIGETSFRGPVFIAWDAARDGARHPERGHNVVYHEFAHKLDMVDGTVDGTPVLASPEDRTRWIEVCTAVYDDLQAGRAGVLLDPYAGVNPGEFFAVATEVFFDAPAALEHDHPDLYDVLRAFYRQDPAARARRTPPRGPGGR
jgi:MtfA peptidase